MKEIESGVQTGNKLENDLAEIKQLLRRLCDGQAQHETPWSIQSIALVMGCSERTARRRKKSDPKFPKPLKSTKYEDRGYTRETQPRWDPKEIRKYLHG